MLPEIIGGVASSGGTAIVSAMAEDSWSQAKTRVARLLTRVPDEQAQVQDHLDRSAAAISAADPEYRQHVVALQSALWAEALRKMLTEHPERLPEVQAFVQQAHSVVVINVRAHDNAQVPVLGRGMQHNTFGAPSARAPDDA